MVRTHFTDLKRGLMFEAVQRFGRILPCGSRKTLDDCFTLMNEQLIFWFNTDDGSTHVICACPHRVAFCGASPAVQSARRVTAILFGSNA
jgi:hypothetical protein